MRRLVPVLLTLLSLSVSLESHAARILFAHVGNYGNYVDDGNRIAGFLSADPGNTVETRYLNQAVYNDYATFDQIFVYDLYHYADNSATQMANYARIAQWYNNLDDQNIILDGRIISSDVWWTNQNAMANEGNWIRNYAEQLDLRGGGLVLGTDHNAFQSGINFINDGIGISRFQGYYGGSQAVVDEASPLYNDSLGLDNCRADPSKKCINDNSSTGFVATGIQANGQVLTPVAFHGSNEDAWDFAAVSASLGSPTFNTCGGPGQPPCGVPTPPALLIFGAGLLLAGFRRNGRA